MEEEMIKTETETEDTVEKSKRTVGEFVDSCVDSAKEFANGLELKDVGLGVLGLGCIVAAGKGISVGVQKIANNPKVKPKLDDIKEKIDNKKKTVKQKKEAVKEKFKFKKKSEPKETPAQEESNEE